ncbi:hypothetical protein [Fictibacillus sp. BK138]|uniref:hypothetical protein n=1 Tax=Fictibacillus sp. BK138 TaxID=2512121 RepID=UPI001028ED79|nr:hypothetical protein [Fictibacillus sp. BK138]RZT21385.1 hypothetical protein EV282_0447 [Fictibacillus sp. BK138]
MTRKNIVLLSGIFLLYLSVNNSEGVHISSLERLATGYNDVTNKMQFYNYLLNLGTMVIYISIIESAIASRFRLRNYIATRGGHKTLINCLLRTVIQHICVILFIKQVVYLFFYFISESFSSFYGFDMLSTFLTLSLLALFLILLKLQGIKEKLSLFSIVSITAIAQFLSYHYPIFSTIVIASAGWQEWQALMLVCKSVGILIMMSIVIFLSKPGKIMEVVEQ